MTVGGQLPFPASSHNSEHPILIPKSHSAVPLARIQNQLLKHGRVNLFLTSLSNQIWNISAWPLHYLSTRQFQHMILKWTWIAPDPPDRKYGGAACEDSENCSPEGCWYQHIDPHRAFECWWILKLASIYLRCRWCGGQRAFEPCTCAVVASTVEPGGDPSWLWELEPETAALAKSFPSVLMVVDWVHS